MPLENKSELIRQVQAGGREQGIGYTLFRNAIARKLRLHGSDFEGLDLLFYRGVTTPSELAEYTGLSSGSTTAMIDRLERAGLVERKSNPDDRRGVMVVITKQAACDIGPLFTSARVAQNELLAGYSKAELETLADYFARSATMFDMERKNITGGNGRQA